MSLPLPNLDDRTYADLVADARARIPAYDPDWTDHNPSDPGITLLELFAWLTEILLYRANRVPDRHVRVFLRLLNGPDPDPGRKPGPDLDEDIRKSVRDLRKIYQAVTATDYETLSSEATPEVARAHCVPQRNLTAGTEPARRRDQPGHVSVIILPNRTGSQLQPSADLCNRVWGYLDDRRMLTTRHHVVGPTYVQICLDVTIVALAVAPGVNVREEVKKALLRYLDPLEGGPDGKGWPFGRNVYVSELYRLLEALPGVDYVPSLEMRPEDASARLTEGDNVIGVALAAHHLPAAEVVNVDLSAGRVVP